MRAALAFFGTVTLAAGWFSLRDLRSLHAMQPQLPADRAPSAATETAPPERAAANPTRAPSELSTWRGQLPFGGVPSNDISDDAETGERDSEGDVPDSIDRCPDEGEVNGDEDGCPEPEHDRSRVIVDESGRRITIERSEIIIY